MIQVLPDDFWLRFRGEIRRRASWEAYCQDKLWTPIAKAAAESTCLSFGLELQSEYFHIDVLAYERRVKTEWFDWDLRIAFEHENCSQKGKNWEDELCKLAHVAANLRVLVGYYRVPSAKFLDVLQDRIQLMGDRIDMIPHAKWLLIFGSATDQHGVDPWQVFTITDRRLIRLNDDQPLTPANWPRKLEVAGL